MRFYERQAELVYKAEMCLWPSRTFTFAEASDYLSTLVRSDWFEVEFPDAPSEFSVAKLKVHGNSKRVGEGDRKGDWGVIRLKSCDQITVLHELSHTIDNWDDWHGAIWRGIYLRLVRHEMGFHAYGALKTAFDKLPEGV